MLTVDGPSHTDLPQLQKNWTALRRAFLEHDKLGTGRIRVADFHRILAQFGIHLSKEETFRLLETMDHQLTGTLDYRTFLQLSMYAGQWEHCH